MTPQGFDTFTSIDIPDLTSSTNIKYQNLSIDPVAQNSPVNSNCVLEISPVCSSRTCKHLPDLTSHIYEYC